MSTPLAKAGAMVYSATYRAKGNDKGSGACPFETGERRKQLIEYVAGKLQQGTCGCCGGAFRKRERVRGGKKGVRPDSPTLERVIPALGYVLGNVVVWCHSCNAAKGSKSLAEFDEWLARAYHLRIPQGLRNEAPTDHRGSP